MARQCLPSPRASASILTIITNRLKEEDGAIKTGHARTRTSSFAQERLKPAVPLPAESQPVPAGPEPFPASQRRTFPQKHEHDKRFSHNRFAEHPAVGAGSAAAGLGGSSASEKYAKREGCWGAVRAPEVGLVSDPNLATGDVLVSRGDSELRRYPGGTGYASEHISSATEWHCAHPPGLHRPRQMVKEQPDGTVSCRYAGPSTALVSNFQKEKRGDRAEETEDCEETEGEAPSQGVMPHPESSGGSPPTSLWPGVASGASAPANNHPEAPPKQAKYEYEQATDAKESDAVSQISAYQTARNSRTFQNFDAEAAGSSPAGLR